MKKPSSPGHIAIYIHTLYNGGIERVMFNLIQGFLARGFAVDLVLDILVYSPFEKVIPEGTTVVKLEAHKYWQRLPKLIGYLKDRQPDALLSATHFSNEISCLATALAGTKTRLIVSEHTNLLSDIRDSPAISPRRLLPLTTRLLYPLAKGVVAVSNGVAEDMCNVSKLPRKLVQTIYNPIDFKALSATAREPMDEPWFAPGEPPVILGIGRMERQKNFKNLLHSLVEVRRHREARLIILGEGSERRELRELIEALELNDAVSMPGFVMNPAAYMARSAVFAMSSSWEGMPVALLEALSLGTPVVSTDCPSGPAEILDSGKYGELVPMNDSGALAKAILSVLDGNVRKVAPGWLDQFGMDAAAEGYLDLMGLPTGVMASEEMLAS